MLTDKVFWGDERVMGGIEEFNGTHHIRGTIIMSAEVTMLAPGFGDGILHTQVHLNQYIYHEVLRRSRKTTAWIYSLFKSLVKIQYGIAPHSTRGSKSMAMHETRRNETRVAAYSSRSALRVLYGKAYGRIFWKLAISPGASTREGKVAFYHWQFLWKFLELGKIIKEQRQ